MVSNLPHAPSSPRLTFELHHALRAIRDNQDILVLPADKDNASVVMTRQNYVQRNRRTLKRSKLQDINNISDQSSGKEGNQAHQEIKN